VQDDLVLPVATPVIVEQIITRFRFFAFVQFLLLGGHLRIINPLRERWQVFGHLFLGAPQEIGLHKPAQQGFFVLILLTLNRQQKFLLKKRKSTQQFRIDKLHLRPQITERIFYRRTTKRQFMSRL